MVYSEYMGDSESDREPGWYWTDGNRQVYWDGEQWTNRKPPRGCLDTLDVLLLVLGVLVLVIWGDMGSQQDLLEHATRHTKGAAMSSALRVGSLH